MKNVSFPIQTFSARQKPNLSRLVNAPPYPGSALVIATPAGSGTFSGYAPDAVVPVIIEPATGAGTFSGAVAVLDDAFPINAGTGQFLGYYPPTYLVDGSGGGPGLSLLFSLNIEGLGIQVPAGAGAFAGHAPALADALAVPAGSGTFAGHAPALSDILAVPAGSAAFIGQAPTLNGTFAVGAGSGIFAGYSFSWNETLPIGAGSGAFAGYVPLPQDSGAGGTTIAVPAGAGAFAGHAPAVGITLPIGAGSGAFAGYSPTWADTLPIGTGSGTFAGYAPTIPGAAVEEERYAGGWYMARYEQQARRRRAKRKKLEEAIEAEISALLREEPAVPAETVVPEYVEEIRALIDEGIRRDREFRRFIDELKLKQSADELARLLAIDAAIRQYIRQREEEEEFIQILMLAA